jgi:hypothetical protein
MTDDMKVALAKYNKEYRDLHRERLLNNKKNIYQRDKERISQERLVKVRCSCGISIGIKGINKHKKSKQHIMTLTDQFFN